MAYMENNKQKDLGAQNRPFMFVNTATYFEILWPWNLLESINLCVEFQIAP